MIMVNPVLDTHEIYNRLFHFVFLYIAFICFIISFELYMYELRLFSLSFCSMIIEQETLYTDMITIFISAVY